MDPLLNDLYLLDCHWVIDFEDLVIEDQLKFVVDVHVLDEDVLLIVKVLT